MPSDQKYPGTLIEYLDAGRLRPALMVRADNNQVGIVESGGRERAISRDLVLVRHNDRKATRDGLAQTLAGLEEERGRLAAELDLNLLWEVVHDHDRAYSAEELAELFFGTRSSVAVAVMLDALLADKLFFVRRHLQFVTRSAEQVERLRTQYERIRLRSESGRRMHARLRAILHEDEVPADIEEPELVEELGRYLRNPFTRNRETTAMLEAVAGDIPPAEAAYDILERLGAAPPGPRFAVIGGLRSAFPAEVMAEAATINPAPRKISSNLGAITIDDEETIEIDDAISCEDLPEGGLRVRIHIALVADCVAKGGPIDREAAARGATVYLPETTVRMLPDRVSADVASLIAGRERNVLTTDLRLSDSGELLSYEIYPETIQVGRRLSYDEADAMLGGHAGRGGPIAAMLHRLNAAAIQLRTRRRDAGAIVVQRREAKIRVSGDDIEVRVIDNSSPSRQLVAELMVLSNYAAARLAGERQIPMVYRVQTGLGTEPNSRRPHLSLYPEFHAGIGLGCYAQLSSPIRRYMDLVLQRQLMATLSGKQPVYQPEELMALLAGAENAETESRELERRAKRYWLLRFLAALADGRPLEATVLRDGASAELDAYALRGTLHGAPNIASNTRVLVQLSRVDPLRGWLALDYLTTLPGAQGAA